MKLKSKEEYRQIFQMAKDELKTLWDSSVIRVLLPDIKKSLEKQGTQRKSPGQLVVKLAIYDALSLILIVLLKNQIWWQISVIVFMVLINSARFWLMTISASIQSRILGGRLAIDNPPSLGKTFIELVDHEGKQIWKSEEIVFNPNKNLDDIGRPLTVAAMFDSGHWARIPDQRIRIYLDYRKMREEGKTNIFDQLAAKHNLNSRTVKDYIEECSNLTDLEKYLEKHPID